MHPQNGACGQVHSFSVRSSEPNETCDLDGPAAAAVETPIAATETSIIRAGTNFGPDYPATRERRIVARPCGRRTAFLGPRVPQI